MAVDFSEIAAGGLSNVVDNVDKFIEYPGQGKLDQITGLSSTYNATESFGDLNALDLSDFSGSEQTSIMGTLTNMDSLSSSNTSCMDNVAGYIGDAISNYMNNSSILDAYKSNNGIDDCLYGMGVLLNSEGLLDDYLGSFDTSILSNTFGRMVNNIAGGIDSTIDFLADIEILKSAYNALSVAGEVLCQAFLALVNAAAAILDQALAYLSNLGLLGRLATHPCVTMLLPDGAEDVMGDINNQLRGIDSVTSDTPDLLIDTVTSVAPDSVTSSIPKTRTWINPNTVTNATIGNSNRRLYNRVDSKIDRFNPSTTSVENVYTAPTTSYGSVAASVPSVNNYSNESMTYNPVTRSWE